MENESFTIERKWSHFTFLYDNLVKQFGVIFRVPKLRRHDSKKTITYTSKDSDSESTEEEVEFQIDSSIKDGRLQSWINTVLSHPILEKSSCVRLFFGKTDKKESKKYIEKLTKQVSNQKTKLVFLSEFDRSWYYENTSEIDVEYT